jgi:hypothetical protein
LAQKVNPSPGTSTGSHQKVSDVEIAVFGSRAHLEKQALATVNLLIPRTLNCTLSFLDAFLFDLTFLHSFMTYYCRGSGTVTFL